MAVFEYRALDAKGRQKKGVLEADGVKQIRQQLRDMGLIPLDVVATLEREKRQASARFSFRRGISAVELALTTRQLATLVQSGMPIEESLKAVAEQCDKARLSKMIMAVRGKVLEGFTLADSMREFPQVFDDLYCATVAAGEKSGHLDTVLNRLADYTEARQQTRSKLIQALVYPIALTVIATLVITILLAAVVPKVVAQFEHVGSTLPGSTQFLIAASDFVREQGLLVVLLAGVLLLAWQQALRNPKFQLSWHRTILKLPVFGKVSRGLNTARYARTLSILNASSVPLLESMRIAAEVLTNQFIRVATGDATTRVREGVSLRAALSETRIFPPMMLHMIASGEKSGELDNMLDRAAQNQEQEFDTMLTVAMGLLGPLVLVVMAAVVLFIVIAILQPIMELNNLVGR